MEGLTLANFNLLVYLREYREEFRPVIGAVQSGDTSYQYCHLIGHLVVPMQVCELIEWIKRSIGHGSDWQQTDEIEKGETQSYIPVKLTPQCFEVEHF